MLKLNFKVAPSAKPEVHYNYKTALLSAEDQAAAMGSLSCNENFLEFGRQVFEIGEWTDIQTGMETRTLIAILRNRERKCAENYKK